ncbi:RNA polymerase sigma factor SigZ [Endozoicomonas arenosclerae]|uniref:RNA polymerase sigma factor SigZ n=1 Tax=Endozoicomonas arenosclerae TaxID=1633495 RepID=UPI000B1CBF81|nr:RNA polymerase sigma factor SigZ [Endozoicomonas arenosclerae]
MARGTVILDQGQLVLLPEDANFPDEVKEVNVLVRGQDRILSPVKPSWNAFFLEEIEERVTDDFMAERVLQDQEYKVMLNHWQEHKARLMGFINKEVGDPSTAEDILQDVYIKAHTQGHTLKDESSMGAWLYRIAHNAIMDHYRKLKPVAELTEFLEEPDMNQPNQAHQDLARCLDPLIKELPEKYRLPLQMAELEGMSQQQVADKLGLSLSGAKSRIQRGRVQLKQSFTDCCDIEVSRGGVTDFQPKKPGCGGCEKK